MSKKIGIALGGGAVLGAAHVGVLRAIEESKVDIDYLTGTSIGAFVASLYAFGKSSKEIEEITSDINWMDITSISLSRYALLSNDKIGKFIKKHIGEVNIEDAEIPLSLIATDASNGDKVILKKGPLADAVMASMAIPGIFIPIEIGDQLLVDGGIVENVPIHTLNKMGADYVIGVDLNASHQFEKPKNILEVLLNSFHFIMRYSTKLQTESADLLIKPDLSKFSRSSMDNVDALIKQGYKDAKKVLEGL